MGADSSKQSANSSSFSPRPVVVTERGAQAPAVDPDLAALQRLPPVAPLLQPPTLQNLFARRADPALPSLHPRNVSALCREYASLSRHAALPICEEQRAIAKKMAGVEALCARVLYMTALRSTELTSSTSTIRELQGVGDQIGEARTALQQCVARAERLERRIDALAMPSTPTAALDGGTPPLSTTPRHS